MPELYARLLRVYTEATSMTQLSDIVHSNPDILGGTPVFVGTRVPIQSLFDYLEGGETLDEFLRQFPSVRRDRKSTRLNSSHSQISYAVFCLTKKKSRNSNAVTNTPI